MIYVAFVSHDDEHEMVPIGWESTPEMAKKLCEDYVNQQQHFSVVRREWDVDAHTRIPGEFWNWETVEDGARYHFYVRPIDINCLGASQSIPPGPGGKGGIA
jgi:hypothetical protein